MDKEHEKLYHELEATNWWFVSRRKIICALTEKLEKNRNAKILDVGCASGELILLLKQKGYKNVYGVDISEKAIKQCVSKEIKTAVKADGSKTKFNAGEFDIVIASDVLEHFENDSAALLEWKRVLKPSGKLIVFVPAFPDLLWSNHDVEAHHFRRYSEKSFLNAIKGAGFFVERVSFWNFVFFFPVIIMRIIKNSNIFKLKSNDIYKLPESINKLFIFMMDCEKWLISREVKMPAGISLFAIAKKNN